MGRVRRDGALINGATLDDDGYMRIAVLATVPKKRVHRLVLETFKGPCPPGMTCRHLDRDRTNNRLSNLKWGTSEEQKADMRKHDTIMDGTRNPAYKHGRYVGGGH